MFSQVCKTSAILEYPFHLTTIFEGVFGFLGSLPCLRFLAVLVFFSRRTGERSIIRLVSTSCMFSFRLPQAWLRTASSLASLSSSLSTCNLSDFKLPFFISNNHHFIYLKILDSHSRSFKNISTRA